MTASLVAQYRVAGGWLRRYRHRSELLQCEMTFALFTPPQAEQQPVPLLWWLSGLTCTDENFCQKAGAFPKAAELGLAIICPDTSPRGLELPGEHDSYDFGAGAGFYLNALREPWAKHYRMYDYLTHELPALAKTLFKFNGMESISGHSMGGHGALIMALSQPQRFASVSAFAPIVHPMACPWGQKAFSGYLGDDQSRWQQYDACELIRQGARLSDILIDQGDADNFLAEQLKPELLANLCQQLGQPLQLRYQPGYDHSYYFISTFIAEHLEYHAKALARG